MYYHVLSRICVYIYPMYTYPIIYIYIHPHFIPIIVGCIQTLHIHIVDAPFYHYIIISYYVYFISMSNHPEVDRLEYVFLDFLHGHSHLLRTCGTFHILSTPGWLYLIFTSRWFIPINVANKFHGHLSTIPINVVYEIHWNSGYWMILVYP